MDDLYNFLGKKVRLTDTDEKRWVGKVELFDYADDNDRGEDSIAILCDNNPSQLVEFYASEISDIVLA